MRYETTSTGSRLNVTITQLRKSDSGRYRCSLYTYSQTYLNQKFKIIVTDGPPPSKPKFPPRPFPPPTPPQSFRGSTTPSSSTKTTNQQQTETTAGGIFLYPAVPLNVVYVTAAVPVTVVVVVVLLAVFLLLLYKWKKRRSSNDVNSRSHVTDTNMESVVYENSAPVSRLGESGYENVNPSSNYETLNPATMSPDQTYSTIGQQI
ncbi:uncharacterized protein LOC128357692 [Scomber scombrus]|uniref:Uncharacterized protein LOC128357692 n=1 Tax=Scomber scombrus TaxID=13677 RepID=A0AAV1Q069_SCOSC